MEEGRNHCHWSELERNVVPDIFSRRWDVGRTAAVSAGRDALESAEMVSSSTEQSLWRRLELLFASATVAGALLWLAVECSAASRHHYEHTAAFRAIIKPGWLPLSTGIDLTDIQWRQYRENLILLVPSMLLCVWLRRRLAPAENAAEGSIGRRVVFTAGWSCLFAVVIHGTGAFWLGTALTLNFFVAQQLRSTRLAPAWAWGFSLTLAFISKTWGEDYWEERIAGCAGDFLAVLLTTPPTFAGVFGRPFAPLDKLFTGLYAWTRPLNLTMLRLISFNVDISRPEAGDRKGAGPARKVPAVCGGRVAEGVENTTSMRDARACPVTGITAADNTAGWEAGREDRSGPVPRSFLLYVSYVLYPPLYISGPILCYDDFARQLTGEARETGKGSGAPLMRLARALLLVFVLEVVLHYVHFHALSHNLHRIFYDIPNGDLWIPPWQIMAIGFFMLNFMYVKFLIIWRVAGCTAALDEVHTTDNMNRCVCNNYTFAGFWRSWHASLHRWILRYMYVPLGGKARRFVIAWPIFVFVGLWHDLEIRWVAWALLNCFCLCVEGLVLQTLRNSAALTRHRASWWWRYASIVASVANIYLLMVSNLAILYGFQGSYDFVMAFLMPPPVYTDEAALRRGGGGATVSEVLTCNLVGVWWLTCGVILMYDIREREMVAGKLKRF